MNNWEKHQLCGIYLAEFQPLYFIKFWKHTMTIYVGNLDFSVIEKDLDQLFAKYGEIREVYLPIDRETEKFRGFGYLTMGSDAEEAAAIEALNCEMLKDRPLKLQKRKEHRKPAK